MAVQFRSRVEASVKDLRSSLLRAEQPLRLQKSRGRQSFAEPLVDGTKDFLCRSKITAAGQIFRVAHAKNPRSFLESLSPMGTITAVQEIVDGVVYLTESSNITGEVLHVDNGAHLGKW